MICCGRSTPTCRCRPAPRVGSFVRYQQPGDAVVSINAGYAPHSYAEVLDLLAGYSRSIALDSGLLLAAGIGDVRRACKQDRVLVIFDLEDSGLLDGRLDRVDDLIDRASSGAAWSGRHG